METLGDRARGCIVVAMNHRETPRGVTVMEDIENIEKELELDNYDNWVRWILNG